MPSDEMFDVPDSPEALDSIEKSAGLEPPAAWRQTAIQCRQFYTALTEAGFSIGEAMDLVRVIIETAAKHGMGVDGE